MKILYITEVYPDTRRKLGVWGGGEKQFYEISRRITRHGHNVSVLTCKYPGQSNSEVIDGIEIYRVGLSREPTTGGVRKAIFPILSYILRTALQAMRLSPDLIHCNTYFPVYSGLILAKLKRVPLLCTFHDIYGLSGWIKSQNSFIWGLLGHLATLVSVKLRPKRIIAVSPQCKQKLVDLGVFQENINVIPNGVDIELFDSAKTEKVPNEVLYVGRLVNFKHVDWLIESFVRVLKEVPSATLKIVGDGPERENLENFTRRLGIQEHVTFTGLTATYEAVAQYFREAEVFVLPSTVEGESIALKEAMAARLPVIAMKVPGSGVLSLVRNGENGFLIEPGQTDLIAEKIIQLLKDEQKRKGMGISGRKFAEQYDWNIIAKCTLQLYQKMSLEPAN